MSVCLSICTYRMGKTALDVPPLHQAIKIQTRAKNGLQHVKAKNQYATVFLFTNPLSPLLSRWLIKGNKKKKKKTPHQLVIICAINSAGYVPVERLQMAW